MEQFRRHMHKLFASVSCLPLDSLGDMLDTLAEHVSRTVSMEYFAASCTTIQEGLQEFAETVQGLHLKHHGGWRETH